MQTKRSKHHHNKNDPPSPSYPNQAGSPPPSHHPSQSFANGNASGLGNPLHSSSADETAFFDRVKKYIDNRTTYHEFLKLLNLFVQEIIDIRTLVEHAATDVICECIDRH